MIRKINYFGIGLQGTYVQNDDDDDGEAIFPSCSQPRDQLSNKGGTGGPY